MRSKTVVLAVGLGVLPSASEAQVEVRVRVPLPTIRFEVPPPLVVVSEGVQVVPEYREEVFAVDGWYWHRADGVWYRTRDHRGGWVVVQRDVVPVALVQIPPGKYKRHRGRGPKKVYVQEPYGRIHEMKVEDRGGGRWKDKDKDRDKGKGKEKRGKGRWK
jgi:hypothetical protein